MIDGGNQPDFIVLVMSYQSLRCRSEGGRVFAGRGKRHADFRRGMYTGAWLKSGVVLIPLSSLVGREVKLCGSVHTGGHEVVLLFM